jgi:deazaflavin-dependent oxidoreductase (nitroreductase family)
MNHPAHRVELRYDDFNAQIIDEFRSNEGHVGGRFERQPLLLLHHKGAKTGTERVNPLAYASVDRGWAVFASKAGADTNPEWFHNLLANPETRIEVGTQMVDVRARVAVGDERTEIWERHKNRTRHSPRTRRRRAGHRSRL